MNNKDIQNMHCAALKDIESNMIVDPHTGTLYFGAGKSFGLIVYTRDISYSGILGLNRLYPEVMYTSLKHTRQVRRKCGFTVCRGYPMDLFGLPWELKDLDEPGYIEEFHSNSVQRRTDDVIWIWAFDDLLKHKPSKSERQWMYDEALYFFKTFYDPFYDSSDGLFFGQASFVDVHFTDSQSTGYPRDWTIEDCLHIKTLSTNSLYYKAMTILSDTAADLGLREDAEIWNKKASSLKGAVLRGLLKRDGKFAYYKDRWGDLSKRRHNLGEALAVLSGLLGRDEAADYLDGYPLSDKGTPLFLPFYEEDDFYHNNSSWPFADTLYLLAMEKVYGNSLVRENLKILENSFDGDSFREVVDYRSGKAVGSSSQLWTAAAFINLYGRMDYN